MVRGQPLSDTAEDLRQVRWLNVPTEAFLAYLRHLEDLTHELQLLQAGGRSGVVEVPAALAATIGDILDAYQSPHRVLWRQLLEAAHAGRKRTDVVLWLPLAAVEASRRLLSLLDEADELCRSGTLMTMPATDAVVAIRRWTSAELERQLLHGAEPLPHP